MMKLLTLLTWSISIGSPRACACCQPLKLEGRIAMRALGCLVGVVLAVSFSSASAQEGPTSNPALNDPFWIAAGVFYPKTTTTARLDSSRLGVGTSVDFEQALGLKDQETVPDIAARWRFAEHWRVEVEYFDFNRNGDRTLDRQIQWGDQVFQVNAQVHSKFDFSDTRISVGWSFYKTPDKELGVGLGFHMADYNASISTANLGANNGKVLAPLPVLSVYGQFALNNQWAVSTRLDRFSLKYGDYDGNITALGMDLNYQPFRYVGFGLAY